MNNIRVYNDGDKVPLEIEEEYSIRYLNLPVNIENKLSMDFVGIIIKKENPLIVFPKHFVTDAHKTQEDSQILIQVLKRTLSAKGFGSTLSDKNFPLNAYLYICEFYKKHGLYLEQESVINPGYKGKINWKYTVVKSPKVLNNNNIIFMPFMLNQKRNYNVLITTCMEEVLAHGYKVFGKHFNIGVKYFINRKHSEDYQIKQLARQLKILKNNHFKDSILKLINALIQYFDWAASSGNEVHFLTTNFDIVWEEMVKNFLDNYFLGIDTSENPHQMIFDPFGNTQYQFDHKKSEIIKQDTPSGRKFSVQYDHIVYNNNKNEIIILDAKYFQKIMGLNYKQFSYAHLLLNKIIDIKKDSNEEVQLINGLILPTEQGYHSKIHINRESIDGIYITEHYLNIRFIMLKYIN